MFVRERAESLAPQASQMSQHETFILTAVGTQGDLLPLLAIARELSERGYAAHVLGNECGAKAAALAGISYTTIAPTYETNLGGVESNFGRYVFPSYLPTFRFFDGMLKQSRALVVVNLSNHAASTLVCERLGLPLCRLVLAPFNVPDGTHRATHPFILRHYNLYRAQLGLAPIATTAELDARIDHFIALFPDWYGPALPTWPANLNTVGFPLGRSTASLPARALSLVQRHGAPLVFTPGTGAHDVAAFFAEARRCCEELDMPGVFLSPRWQDPGLAPGGKLVHFDYLELELILEHAALLVHHGGIGTTARALEAGVPQIISPEAFDQPDNARRVCELGAGARVLRPALTANSLAAAARQLLESREVHARLANYAQRIRRVNPAARAAELLIQHLGSPRTNELRRARVRCSAAAVAR
jgi:rhamnosyltransferase subunit B